MALEFKTCEVFTDQRFGVRSCAAERLCDDHESSAGADLLLRGNGNDWRGGGAADDVILVGDVGLACIWVVFNLPLGWLWLTPTPA
jgi:hypothetical protein